VNPGDGLEDRLELEVPARFWSDHDARECVLHSGLGSAYVVRSGSRLVRVRLHPRDIANLYSDAEFYSDTGDEDQDPGLRRSAEATVVRLEARYSLEELRAFSRWGRCWVQVEGRWCEWCGAPGAR